MVTYNKESLVIHNLLDEIFFKEILEKSILLKEYNLKFYKLNSELEFFCEDLFYIFYKHIVTIKAKSNIHSYLLENIINSISYKKIILRTSSSTFETYLVLKYFMDQILIRLKGSRYIEDINNFYKEEQLTFDDLSSIRNEIGKIIREEATSTRKTSILKKEKLILRYILEKIIGKSKLDSILLTSYLKETLLDEIKDLVDNSFSQSSSLKYNYNDFLDHILDSLQSKSNVKNNHPIQSIGLNQDTSDLREKLIDKIKGLLVDDELDANKLLESLILQIEELSPIEGDNAHEDGPIKADETKDSHESSENEAVFTNSNSINTILSHTLKSDFESPDLHESDCETKENYIIDGKKNDSDPIHEEIIGLIRSFKAYEKKSFIHENIKDTDNLFRNVIKRLEKLEAKIIINKNKIRKISKKLNIEKDLSTSLKMLEDSLASVKSLGISKHSLSALDIDQAIDLEKRLRSSDFKRFIDKVGKKKIIAAKAKQKKIPSKDNLVDKIIPSDDLDNLIEDEILQFSLDIDEFEWDFYDRLLNNSILSNQFVSNLSKNKGPIILCYDGSGSMEGEKIEETKAHIIAILDIAKYQKRKVILIQFASKKEDLIIKNVNPSYISIGDIYEIYDTFIKGGTDFEKPLRKSMQLLKDENYKDGDILFITDGHCEISKNFIEEFNLAKQIRTFKLYSIIMHGHTYSDYGDLAKISDEVLEIKKSNLNDWNEKTSSKIFSII